MARALAAKRRPQRVGQHESFLRYGGFAYLKIATLISLIAIAGYFFADPTPRHNGGSWLGYTLGTIGALLIVWLALLGVRKRAITPGRWSLRGWTSAHVYLGLSLLVIATLHTGFQFGWNVHTLAYALMVAVIGSGVFGIYYYGTIPRRMSDNRAETSRAEMIAELGALDVELRAAAQPLSEVFVADVERSITRTKIAGGLMSRLDRRHPKCPHRLAMRSLRDLAETAKGEERDALDDVLSVMERKAAMLDRARQHVRFRTLLELWLYVHVPATFALLAALSAHVFSVFFYW